jgi:transglutaminase-like putative cysteine protease
MYRVRHHYRYVYTAPICNVRQRLVMIPPAHHADQMVVSFDLAVRGTSGRLLIDWQTDQFGNRVCRVEAETVEHALDFEAWFSVCRGASVAEPTLTADEGRAYLSFTGLTAPDERITDAARTIQAQTPRQREQAELALQWAASSIAYQVGVTSTHTPAAMALHLGQGVCQDYAHIMLSLLRVIGIPARYVSGHLLGEGAPHAWVEVLLYDPERNGFELLAYDPTHRRVTNLSYITVAVGRDFADVSGTSGVFSGAALGKLHWTKHAERIEPATSQEASEVAA